MRGRHTYIVLAAALFGAAIAAGVATWLDWLPCRGSLLNGSILIGYQYPTDFSAACLARMDGSDAVPLAAGAVEARVLSMALLGLGWLVFALRLRLPVRLRAVAMLPVVPIGWLALTSAVSRDASSVWEIAAPAVFIELTAAVAALAIGLGTGPGLERNLCLVGLLGVAAYGGLHSYGDYTIIVSFSDASWDTPPGTGYFTAAMIAVCGVLVIALGRRASRVSPRQAQGSPASLPRAAASAPTATTTM